MKKVLHLLNYLGNGGTETYIYLLAKKLHNKNCKFYLAYSEDGIGRKMFEDLGVELIHMNMRSPFDINGAKELKRICRELSIDVIHTHFLRENYISIISKLLGNRPKLINTRHMLLENSKGVILTNKVFTRFNDAIIAVSSSVKRQLLEEGISEKRIELIYNGIDISEWDEPITLTFRKELNIPEDVLLITSVARFTEEKGHEFLLDSIHLLREYIQNHEIDGKRFKFILVGDGILLENMKKKAYELGINDDIIFTGFRRDIKDILKSSDIYISHSKSEAFGISILEAIAAHLPVITTDSGGTKEIINPESNNGILIDYGDKEALVENIFKLINDEELRNSYSSKAIELTKQKFNLDKIAQSTYNLYSLE